VAHSLGGLVARYAIGRLYEPQNRAKSSSSAEGCLDEGNCLEGRIVGLEPMNFITSASPHLGSMGHKQVRWIYRLLIMCTFTCIFQVLFWFSWTWIILDV
jgi:hypothetical protein